MKLKYLFILSAFMFLFASNSAYSQNELIEGVTVKSGIKLVWDVRTNLWEAGVGAGLRYPDLWTEKYESMDITQSDYAVSVVVHDDAGYWVLNDESYNAHTNTTEGNPNKGLINILMEKGLSMELCGTTMANNKWTAENLLPGIKILVKGAYVRITDLQMQGYGYVMQ